MTNTQKAFLKAARAYYAWSPGDEPDLKELGREMDALGYAMVQSPVSHELSVESDFVTGLENDD